MATRETRLARGKARGLQLEGTVLGEIRRARTRAGVSQRSMGSLLGWSQAEYWRFENGLVDITFRAAAIVASILGMELTAACFRSANRCWTAAIRRS